MVSTWSAEEVPSRGFLHIVTFMYNIPSKCFEVVTFFADIPFVWLFSKYESKTKTAYCSSHFEGS